MSKERDIQILEYKIQDLDTKIREFETHNISEKKIENLKLLKLKYETQLEELQNS